MKLISLNIERRKHLPRVLPFVQTEAPDMLCLQEVMAQDVPQLAAAMGAPHHAFCPMNRFVSAAEDLDDQMGVALFSRTPLEGVAEQYYYGGGRPSTVYDREHKVDTQRYMLLAATVGGVRVATTRAPVTARGSVDAMQIECFDKLLALLEKTAPDVLTGDFNAPRGRASFDRLAAVYTDNIPAHYTTSLDPVLHRAGPLPYVVDGLFTKPPRTASAVRLVPGLSDHQAVVGLL
jgi:exonuclease III